MSYEVLESRKTYEGKIVTITVDKLRMPDGSEAYRETVIRKKNAAGVLAVDTDGRLLFVRQYRHPFREMLLEIPAGVIEEGESGEGLKLRASWRSVRQKGRQSGISLRVVSLCRLSCTEKIQLFFCHRADRRHQKLDADEFVEIEKYTLRKPLQ